MSTGAIQQLGLEPLRQYIHAPYVRAGYPGGLDDDEVVAAGATCLSAIFTCLLIGFYQRVLFLGFWVGVACA